MSASLGNKANAEPDLTPVLDLVFQLITFFMLVINFKSAALDLTLKLPVIGSARPVDTQGAEQLLILNVDATGQLMVYGVSKDIERYIATEAQAILMVAQQANPKLQDGDELPTTVVVRADRSTPFGLLNRVIKACQKKGFRKFSLMATDREAEEPT